MHLQATDIDAFDRFYRANLINSITGFKPANLIGTIGNNDLTNLAIFSSVVHLGSNPALVGFVQRPLLDTSHTYKNIKENGFYTINHVNDTIVQQAHHTSAKFEDGISEFDTCRLSPYFLPDFNAPFVGESHIKFGLEYVTELPIAVNNTILVIGKIVHILINDTLINIDGNLDLEKVQTVAISGLDTYYSASKLVQLPYAKANNTPSF